jgi:hypothetical protein
LNKKAIAMCNFNYFTTGYTISLQLTCKELPSTKASIISIFYSFLIYYAYMSKQILTFYTPYTILLNSKATAVAGNGNINLAGLLRWLRKGRLDAHRLYWPATSVAYFYMINSSLIYTKLKCT